MILIGPEIRAASPDGAPLCGRRDPDFRRDGLTPAERLMVAGGARCALVDGHEGRCHPVGPWGSYVDRLRESSRR